MSKDKNVIKMSDKSKGVINGDLFENDSSIPAHLVAVQGSSMGREDVGAEDLVVPRLEIVQDLSPARKPGPAQIAGAESGYLFNNVTRRLYGSMVRVIPAGFKKEWLLWKTRKKGGGFGGAYATKEDAEHAKMKLDGPDDYEVVDTAQQFCLVVHQDGTGAESFEEIVVSMAKSKAKMSRKWNSLIRIADAPSFARRYRITTYLDTNNKGETFYNFDIASDGFPSVQAYNKALAMYNAYTAGKVVASRSEESHSDTDSSKEY